MASLSIPVSSTIVAQLGSSDYLNWSSKTNELDSTIEQSGPWITREVTIADLFSHCSGLIGDAGDNLESFNYNRSEILSRMESLRPTGSFRIIYTIASTASLAMAERNVSVVNIGV